MPRWLQSRRGAAASIGFDFVPVFFGFLLCCSRAAAHSIARSAHTTCQVSQQQWQQAIAKLLSCGLAPRGHFECVYARRLTSSGSCSTIHTKHLSLATSLRPKLAASPYSLSLRKLCSMPPASVACLMHNKNRCFVCCAAEERVPKHDLWLICCQSSLDSLSIVFH